MDNETTTRPEMEDVAENDVVEQTEENNNQDVASEDNTTVDDYAAAWENIDIEQPPAELFGDTTEEVPSEEPVSEEPAQVEQNINGLVITNPVLKFRGKDVPIDSEEEMLTLAQKGFRFESEMSKIKPLRPLIKIIEDAGLTAEDIKALADMKAGKKEALGYLKQSAGIEEEETYQGSLFDEQKEDKGDYKPAVEADDPVASIFAELTTEQPEVAGKVSKVYDDIDDSFKAEVYNPNVFPMFVSSVSSGEFDKIYPLAIKAKTMNPALSWLEAYAMAGKQSPVEDKKVVPPKDTAIPKNKQADRNVKKLNYNTAYDLPLEELEKRLFG
jgi:hypothetical protein